jgi:zinc transport system permease protein
MMPGPLAYDFMQNALAAGLLASVACGVIGSLVVVNRLVFLAGGMAHAAYGGVGLAFFLGLPVMPTTVGFTLAASGVMGACTLRRGERADTVIGALWAAGMALGVILLDLTPGYNVDLMSYLFGSILTVSRLDLLAMAGLDAVLIALIYLFYKDFLTMSFDREFARTSGVPVTALHFLLMAMVAVSVVMIIQLVGLILVIALLTIPPHLAERRSASLSAMMVRTALWSAFFCTAGLLLAYAADTTSGATIIALAAICYFGANVIGFVRKKRAEAAE